MAGNRTRTGSRDSSAQRSASRLRINAFRYEVIKIAPGELTLRQVSKHSLMFLPDSGNHAHTRTCTVSLSICTLSLNGES